MYASVAVAAPQPQGARCAARGGLAQRRAAVLLVPTGTTPNEPLKLEQRPFQVDDEGLAGALMILQMQDDEVVTSGAIFVLGML
ncbi:MAG TPA: hypothetical protein VK714_15160 [Myxococcota bacterium]|nr:hypothetical protein [Myxococcota bacterium]